MKKRATALLTTTLILFPLLSMSPETHAANHRSYQRDRDIVQNWKKYYNGSPSFKLKNDFQMKKFDERISKAEANIAETQKNLKPFKDIISAENKAIQERNKRNKEIQTETLSNNKERVKLVSRVKSLEDAVSITTDEAKKAQLQKQLDEARTKLVAVESKLTALVQEEESNTAKNAESKKKIAQAKEKSAIQEKLLAKLQDNKAKIEKQKREYKRTLVLEILRHNREGTKQAIVHATEDATILAREDGELHGIRNGSIEGERIGRERGQARVRQEATQEGRGVGERQARVDGEARGRDEGYIQGNRRKASEVGERVGIEQAINSDAKIVGQKQGINQANTDALTNGQNDGRRLGEEQAISENEKQNLKKKEINGSFVGAFSEYRPDYPTGRSRGNRYNDRRTHKNEIMTRAYGDGYKFTYEETHRDVYFDKFDQYYLSFKEEYLQRNIELFSNRDYPIVRQNAFEQARNNAYNDNYENFRYQARSQAAQESYNNPDTSSEVYTSTYESARSGAYSVRYNALKDAAYSAAYKQTYGPRYEAEKEIARSNSKQSTQELYNTSAVLKLESVSIRDAGIDKVGADDGIMQPGENKTYTIVVSNYGAVAKSDVKVIVNGVAYQIASIPAKTTATIKAAAKAKVTGTLNTRDRDQIVIVSTAKNKIEARHFVSAKDGILSSQVKDNGIVQYPFSLDHLSLAGELLRGKAVNLRARVANNSKRSYDGVRIVVESDTDGVIKKTFTSLNNFKGSKTLSDAVLSVTKKSDTYTPISISAYLEKNGVVLGEASRALNVYSKEAFDNSKKTVLVVDSHDSLRATKDLINKLGGLENTAILDTSVRNANNSVLAAGLKEKAVVISAEGDVINKIRGTLKKSQDTALVALEGATFQKLTNLSEIYNKSTYIQFNLAGRNKETGVRFANPRLNKGIKSSLPIISASRNDFATELSVAKAMAQTEEKLIAQLNKDIKESNFFNGNQEIRSLVEGATIKTIDDILQINKEYDESVKVFGDKKIADKVKDDKTLFHNKLNTAMGNKAKSSNLGLYMFASEAIHAIKDGLNNKKEYKKIMRDTITKRLFEYKKGIFGKKRKGPLSEAEKKLGTISKVSKSVQSKLSSSKGQYKPFKMD